MDTESTVGVFMPVRPTDAIALGAHDGEFVAALERELRGHDRFMTLRGATGVAEVRATAHRFSGVALLGFQDDEIQLLPELGTSVVAIDSYADRGDFAFVRADDFDGGRRAAVYLTTRGHRDILFVGPAQDRSGVVRERRSGFESQLIAAEATPHRHVTSGTTRREGVTVGRTMGERHPAVTAVFAMADTLAAGIVEGLALSGRSVPGDVSVIGFDDLGLASMTTPKLSSVAQGISRKARLAADALVLPGLGNHLFIVGVDIVERASVAPRLVDDDIPTAHRSKEIPCTADSPAP